MYKPSDYHSDKLPSELALAAMFHFVSAPSNVHDVAYCIPKFPHFKANGATRRSDELTLPVSIIVVPSTTTCTREGE